MLQKWFTLCFWAIPFTVSFAQSPALFPIKVNQRWGFMNAQGQEIVAATYHAVDEFDEFGYAIVNRNGQLGILDINGNEKINCQYELIQVIDSTLLLVRNQKRWELRNSDNELLLDSLSGHVKPIGNGYFMYQTLEGYGLAHIKFGKLVKPIYQHFEPLPQGYFKAILANGKMGMVDSLGKEVLTCQYDDLELHVHFILARMKNSWGLYQKTGQELIACEWDMILPKDKIFIELFRNQKKQLYSLVVNKVIEKDYYRVEAFEPGLLIIGMEVEKYGLIDSLGQMKLPAIYSDIQSFSNTAYRVQKDFSRWGLVGLENEPILFTEYDYIGSLNSSVAIIRKLSLNGLVNFDGEVVLEVKYPNLTLDQNMAKAKTSDNKLHLFHFESNGQLADASNYSNFRSLKIVNNLTDPVVTNPGTQRRELEGDLIWFRGRNGKWGVKNALTDDIVLNPQYDDFLNYPNLGFTIVTNSRVHLGGIAQHGYAEVFINNVYGIVNNSIGKPVTKMEFIDIRLSDFLSKNLPVARCVFMGGAHGIIAKNGKILTRGFVYIDEFVEGKARATNKGNLETDFNDKQKRPLIEVRNYYGNMLTSYTFSPNNPESVTRELVDKGKLYVEDPSWGYLDTFGRFGIAAQFEHAESFSNGVAIVSKKGKWGLIGSSGEVLVAPEYDDIDFISNSDKQLYYVSKSKKRYGCIDADAKVVVPVCYDKVKQFSDGMIAVYKNNRWGFVNKQGQEVIECKYRQANDFSEGLAAVSDKGYWGFIDKSGTYQLKAIYIKAGNFKEGLAWVQLPNGKTAFIKPNGEEAFAGKFVIAHDFEEGVARVKDREKGWGLIDTEGNWIRKPHKSYRNIGPFNEHGLALVRVGKKYQLMNREAKLVCKTPYAQIRDFHNGYAVVRKPNYGGLKFLKNMNLIVIDSLGKAVCKTKYSQLGDFYDGLASFRDKNGFGFINPAGEVVIQPMYYLVSDFKEGKAVVNISHKISGVIDISGQYVMAPLKNNIMTHTEELALVKEKYGSYHFLHQDLMRQTAANFQAAREFNGGVAAVRCAGQWGVINHQGLKMITPKYADIDAFEDGFARVKLYQLKGVINVQGEIVVPANYEYISFAGNGLFRIEQGNQVGYLDMKGNWVWSLSQ